MADVGSQAAQPHRTRRPVRKRGDGDLRHALASDFAAAYGRAPQHKQLDWLERVARWLGRCYRAEGAAFTRSVPQIVRGLGLPYDGTVRGARRQYRNQLANTLGYLHEMGWVEAREVLATAGRGRGWALRLAPRGCSSVGYSVSRRGRGSGSCGPSGPSKRTPAGSAAPPRVLSRREGLHPPSGNSTDRALKGSPLSCSGRGRAHANRPYGGPFAVAALEASVRQGSGEASEILQRAWLDGAPLWACLRAAAQALGLPAKLSKRAELQAERSVAQIDRLAGRRGEGVRQLLWRLEEGAESRTGEVAMPTGPSPLIDRRSPGKRPVSIGYYVTAFRRDARKWRRDDKAARARAC